MGLSGVSSADVLLLRDCTSVADWFQVFLCITAVLVFAFGFPAFQKILSVVYTLVVGETEQQRKIREMKLELAVLKREMSTISQVNEFAKYFKKERVANKLTEDLAEIESKGSKEELKKKVFVVAVARILTSVIGLSCMWSSADVKAFRFYSSNTCYPLCFAMDMPRGAGKLLGWSGYYDTDSFMSLFVFVNILVATCCRLPELKAFAFRREIVAMKAKSD